MAGYKNDSLGSRMKAYEAVTTDLRLVPKEPVIIRLDGKAFHTFTKGFEKPFDNILAKSMASATLQLCEEIQNCVFGYTQSDEITLVLNLQDKIKSQSYMNGKLHKQISLSASKVTNLFMHSFIGYTETDKQLTHEQLEIYRGKYFKAEFDSRVFNVPEWDVINNIIWRQKDAIRNSIEALGQSQFSSKELHKKTCNDILDMLKSEKGLDWNDEETRFKRGIAVHKQTTGDNSRKVWVINDEMPIITENREWFSRITGLNE